MSPKIEYVIVQLAVCPFTRVDFVTSQEPHPAPEASAP